MPAMTRRHALRPAELLRSTICPAGLVDILIVAPWSIVNATGVVAVDVTGSRIPLRPAASERCYFQGDFDPPVRRMIQNWGRSRV